MEDPKRSSGKEGAAYGEELVADAHLIPAASLGQKEADDIKKYILFDAKPTTTIRFSVTELVVKPSPVVASFSSRNTKT